VRKNVFNSKLHLSLIRPGGSYDLESAKACIFAFQIPVFKAGGFIKRRLVSFPTILQYLAAVNKVMSKASLIFSRTGMHQFGMSMMKVGTH